MEKGTVKWFDPNKGYGFIVPNDGGNDLFVHYTGIEGNEYTFKTLNDGDVVEYKTKEGEKGPVAVDVNVLEEADVFGAQSASSVYW